MMFKKTESKIDDPRLLRVLMVEDSEDDELLIIRALKKGGYNPVYDRVETAEAMRKALQDKNLDVILCDYKLPKFNAPSAIAVLKETNIDIPLIIISGAIGEETAAECMRLGAHDYIIKNNLSRLCPAVARELKETEVRIQRKRADEALQESEKKYHDLYDFLPIPIYEMDFEANITSANRAIYETFRGTEEDLKIGFKGWQLLSPEEADKSAKNIQRLLKGEQVKGTEYNLRRLDGSVFPGIVISSVIYSNGKPVGLRGAIVDISQRKQAEEALQESEEKYRNLFENVNEAIFVAQDGKVVFFNPMALMLLGHDGAEFASRPFIDFIHPDDRDMVIDRHFRRLKGEDIPRRYSFRLIYKDGGVRWVDLDTVLIKWEGKPATLNFMNDITERRQAEEEREQSLERVRKALMATVHAISLTVEMKDPYTSGHQQRVADLSRAIAAEMGLSAERQDFIRTASTIHDIGKIALPAEILSKPTKLTELEFSLIKTHAQIGFDILKDIEFPWPVADVVLQHHERMNGSGYPNGLKGKSILQEARILAVADVVEAITFHRPYRPALGIDLALEEIYGNKGILYDAAAADACMRLFREKGYTWLVDREE